MQLDCVSHSPRPKPRSTVPRASCEAHGTRVSQRREDHPEQPLLAEHNRRGRAVRSSTERKAQRVRQPLSVVPIFLRSAVCPTASVKSRLGVPHNGGLVKTEGNPEEKVGFALRTSGVVDGAQSLTAAMCLEGGQKTRNPNTCCPLVTFVPRMRRLPAAHS